MKRVIVLAGLLLALLVPAAASADDVVDIYGVEFLYTADQ